MDRRLETLRRAYFSDPENLVVIQQLDTLENRIYGESVTLNTLNVFVTPTKNKNDTEHVSHTLWAKIVTPLPFKPELSKKYKRKAIFKGKKGYKISSIESYYNYTSHDFKHNWGRQKDGEYIDSPKSYANIEDAITEAIKTDKLINELKKDYIVDVYLPKLKVNRSSGWDEWFEKKTKWTAEDFKTQWRLF